jgi:hypothetical protein
MDSTSSGHHLIRLANANPSMTSPYRSIPDCENDDRDDDNLKKGRSTTHLGLGKISAQITRCAGFFEMHFSDSKRLSLR